MGVEPMAQRRGRAQGEARLVEGVPMGPGFCGELGVCAHVCTWPSAVCVCQ